MDVHKSPFLRKHISHLALAVVLILLLPRQGQTFSVPIPVIQTTIGGLAGSAGALAVYPLDYVKSVLQTEFGRTQYKNGVDAAVQIVLASPLGPLALYKGALVNIVGIAPEKAIKLGVNEYVRTQLYLTLGYLPVAGEMFAGGAAGFCQVILTNPLEVIKVRMQTSNATFEQVMADMGGIGGLYTGVSACLLRDVMFSSLLFPLYAHLRPVLGEAMESIGMGDNVFLSGILAGSFAAIPAAIVATPADVMKTRLQCLPGQIMISSNGKNDDDDDDDDDRCDDWEIRDPSTNLVKKFQLLVEKEGYPVLFSGWLERIIRSVPQFGVTLATFEFLTKVAVDLQLLPDLQAMANNG